MKNIIFLIIAIIFFATFIYSQEKIIKESEVPKVVFDSYKIKYPEAKSKSWIEGEDNYEVAFNLNEIELEASFSLKGEWLETIKKIDIKDIPAEVLEGFNSSKYKKWKISETSTAETPEYKLLYFFEVIKNRKSKELYFNPEGKLIKEE